MIIWITTRSFLQLVDVDEMIKNEDKVLILLSSLPDEEYETFILILINGKQLLSYSDVLATLVNHEV